jgi:hypothetical protein
MKRLAFPLLAVALLALSGCIYADVKTPLDTDLNQTKLGSKVGVASNQQLLGLIAWGDASTRAAAEQGGITQINHMDEEVFDILGIVYTRWTTIVYGD